MNPEAGKLKPHERMADAGRFEPFLRVLLIDRTIARSWRKNWPFGCLETRNTSTFLINKNQARPS